MMKRVMMMKKRWMSGWLWWASRHMNGRESCGGRVAGGAPPASASEIQLGSSQLHDGGVGLGIGLESRGRGVCEKDDEDEDEDDDDDGEDGSEEEEEQKGAPGEGGWCGREDRCGSTSYRYDKLAQIQSSQSQ
jgi:hypothetical protein